HGPRFRNDSGSCRPRFGRRERMSSLVASGIERSWRVLLMTMLGVVPLVVAGFVSTAAPASAAAGKLVEQTNFGANPGGLRMFEYVPPGVSSPPAILVVLHFCGGSGPTMFNNTQFANLADQFGYVVIYPSVTRSNLCFDVNTSQALTHNGGSDPVSIVSMVR